MMRLALLTLSALALGLGVTVAARPDDGDASAGAEPTAVRCAFCHGPSGTSRNAIWPSLAGLDEAYLAAQLDAFAQGPEGPRGEPHAAQMYGLAKTLAPAERQALARHYAGQPAPRFDPAAGPRKGADLYARGSGTIMACASCHGADAAGNPEIGAPRLGGQQSRYVAQQLRAYASGGRDDGGTGMADVAKAMNEDEIRAVAAYLGNDEETNR